MRSLSGAFDFALDVFSRAEAGIEKTLLLEFRCCGPVFVEVLALDTDGFFPFNFEPGEVFEDLVGVLRLATGVVDVFDAEEKAAVVFPRKIPGAERCVGVSFVEVAGWAGGKSGYDGCRHYGMFERKVCARNLRSVRIVLR